MNSTILAERQAKAIQAIQEHTARLGGEYIQPSQRANSPAVKYVLILEEVARALSEIEQKLPTPPDEPVALEAAEPQPAVKSVKRKGAL